MRAARSKFSVNKAKFCFFLVEINRETVVGK
jgi:hypothetical protein